jgi:hypothetical protein
MVMPPQIYFWVIQYGHAPYLFLDFQYGPESFSNVWEKTQVLFLRCLGADRTGGVSCLRDVLLLSVALVIW